MSFKTSFNSLSSKLVLTNVRFSNRNYSTIPTVLGLCSEQEIVKGTISPKQHFAGSSSTTQLGFRLNELVDGIRKALLSSMLKRQSLPALNNQYGMTEKNNVIHRNHKSGNDNPNEYKDNGNATNEKHRVKFITFPGSVLLAFIRRRFPGNSLFYEHGLSTAREVAESFPSIFYVTSAVNTISLVPSEKKNSTQYSFNLALSQHMMNGYQMKKAKILWELITDKDNIFIDNSLNGSQKDSGVNSNYMSSFGAFKSLQNSWQMSESKMSPIDVSQKTATYYVTISAYQTINCTESIKAEIDVLERKKRECGENADSKRQHLQPSLPNNLTWEDLLPASGDAISLSDVLAVVNRKLLQNMNSSSQFELASDSASNALPSTSMFMSAQDIFNAARSAATSDALYNSTDKKNSSNSIEEQFHLSTEPNLRMFIDVSISPRVVSKRRGAYVLVDGDLISPLIAQSLVRTRLGIDPFLSTVSVFRHATSTPHGDDDIVVEDVTGFPRDQDARVTRAPVSLYTVPVYQLIQNNLEMLRASNTIVTPEPRALWFAQNNKKMEYNNKKLEDTRADSTSSSSEKSSKTKASVDMTKVETTCSSALYKDVIILCGDQNLNTYVNVANQFAQSCKPIRLNNIFVVTPTRMVCIN